MKRKAIILAVATTAFVTLCTTTNPHTAPSILLVLPFMLLFIMLFSVLLLVLEGRQWSRGRKIRVSGLISGITTGLLVLQSVGQLTIRDGLTILAFFMVGYLYVSRMSKKTV